MNTPRTPAVIVDIDGTVASHTLPDGRLIRGHHEYRLVGVDEPKPDVIAVVEALRASGHSIIFCSGRPLIDDRGFNVGEATYTWLEAHLGAWTLSSPLFMRAQVDQRPDDIVKEEIFRRFIEPDYDARLALDDRDRVVAMWRRIGITCLQVDYGDF